MTLPYLHYEKQAGAAPHSPLLVLLHGRGANESDLLPIVEFVAKGWNAAAVRAPYPLPMGGSEWFKFGADLSPEPRSLSSSLSVLDTTLTHVLEEFPGAPAVYLGFSQGALMALAAATTRNERLQGVAALSGYLPEDTLLPRPSAALRGLPVFQTHARNDFVLPFRAAEVTRARLEKAGATLTWVEHQAGHSVPVVVMERLSEWLADLPGAGRS